MTENPETNNTEQDTDVEPEDTEGHRHTFRRESAPADKDGDDTEGHARKFRL